MLLLTCIELILCYLGLAYIEVKYRKKANILRLLKELKFYQVVIFLGWIAYSIRVLYSSYDLNYLIACFATSFTMICALDFFIIKINPLESKYHWFHIHLTVKAETRDESKR